MFSLLGLKAKLAAFGAAALFVLGLIVRLKVVKAKAKRLKAANRTLKARAKTEQIQKKIKREEEKNLIGEIAKIEAELKKPAEEFKGLEVFNDPNDF